MLPSFTKLLIAEKFPFQFGIEKEALRVDVRGNIAKTNHPEGLGHKLTHPEITTDYGEALLEFITPVYKKPDEALEYLTALHQFTYKHLPGDEVIWPASVPARIATDEDVRVADYGPSNWGQLKSLYRVGLGDRYGRKMQSIAGLHYNFSFSNEVLHQFHQETAKELDFIEFKNNLYFKLIRNFRRHAWLLIYLYGASPVVDESFVEGREHDLHPFGSQNLGRAYATSLRMGGVGYTSSAQKNIKICFNALSTYIESIEAARLLPYPAYEKIGAKVGDEYRQLNTHLLQIDNEYYSIIRPKNVAKKDESALMALQKRGVEYIEVRLLDINPEYVTGIGHNEMHFLPAFLVYCAMETSEDLSNKECEELTANFDKVVLAGRDPKLKLEKNGQSVFMREEAKRLLAQIHEVAEMFKDSPIWTDMPRAVLNEMQKVDDDTKTPSGMMMGQIAQGKNYVDYMLEKAKNYRIVQSAKKIPPHLLEHFRSMSDKSQTEAMAILQNDNHQDFELFLKEYFEKIRLKNA